MDGTRKLLMLIPIVDMIPLALPLPQTAVVETAVKALEVKELEIAVRECLDVETLIPRTVEDRGEVFLTESPLLVVVVAAEERDDLPRFFLLGVPDAFGSLCVVLMCSIRASPFKHIL